MEKTLTTTVEENIRWCFCRSYILDIFLRNSYPKFCSYLKNTYAFKKWAFYLIAGISIMGWTFYKSSTNSKVGPGKYLCNECDKSFRDNFDLKRHVDGVHLNIRHQCDFCDYSFSYKGDLTKHTKRKHQK